MAQLVAEHHAALYRHALWLTGDPALAEDLVQETYYEAWRSLRRLGPPRAGRAWLLAILRRRLARLRAAAERLPEVPLHELAEAPDEGAPHPESEAEAAALARAFAALPAAQREILLLRALHGLAYREIAAVLDVPVGTVMSRLARAREALRARLEPPVPDAADVVPLRPRHAGRRRSDGG